MARTPLVAVAVAASLAATGCARTGDRMRVQTVTAAFFAALERDDGAAACARLSRDTREELESSEDEPCERAIIRLGLSGAAIERVEVYVTSARAQLAGGEAAFLGQEADGWRLSAVGCRPQGKPTEEPYDCEVEA